MIAKIAVSAATFAIDKPYSYRIPEGMALSPGVRVTVPFGCTATLVLPESNGEVIALEPGSYTYCYETRRDLRPGYDRDTPLYVIRKDQKAWDALGAVIPLHNVPKRKRDCSINTLQGRYLFLQPETQQQVDALFRQLRDAMV